MRESKEVNSPICVLLASYNGAKYIEQQVKSIVAQQLVITRLLIRDDGSTDNTVNLVNDLINNIHGSDVTLIKNKTSEHGHLKNFSALCSLALEREEQYFAFSDQDDKWVQDKLLTLQKRMGELESKHGKNFPILIHSDLSVVDRNLNVISNSFIEYQGIPTPKEHDFPAFCYQNVVTGCTMFFNKALLELATPIPQEAVVHDYWFSICAQYFGVVDFVERPLVSYRQHNENAIGASSVKDNYSLLSVNFYRNLVNFPTHLSGAIDQAEALHNLIVREKKEALNTLNYNHIKLFSMIKKSNLFERLRFARDIVNPKKGIKEKIYFYLVFTVVKWL